MCQTPDPYSRANKLRIQIKILENYYGCEHSNQLPKDQRFILRVQIDRQATKEKRQLLQYSA